MTSPNGDHPAEEPTTPPLVQTPADDVAVEEHVQQQLNGGITDEVVQRKRTILQGLAASNQEKYELLLEQGYQVDGDSIQRLREKLMLEAIFNIIVPEHVKVSTWTEFEKTMSTNFDNMFKAIEEMKSQQTKQELLAGTGIPVPPPDKPE